MNDEDNHFTKLKLIENFCCLILDSTSWRVGGGKERIKLALMWNFLKKITLYVRMFCLHVYMWVVCLPGAKGGWKRASDLVKLELQIVVKHHVVAGNRTLVICKSSNALNCQISFLFL